MKLDHIREFLVLADLLNFSRASSRLGVSQPVLTRHIQELEKHFGVVLFTRSTRGMSLTPAGRELVRTGREVSNAYEQMLSSMHAAEREFLNYIHVGVVPAVMFPAVMKASSLSKEKFPQLVVKLHDLTSTLQFKALDNRQIDLALPGQVPEEHLQGYNATPIAAIPLMIAMAENHRLARDRIVDLSDLSRDEFVVFSEKTYPGRVQYVREACLSVGFEPVITDFANGPSAILNAISSGRWVALLPALMQEMSHPGVVFRHLKQRDLKVVSHAVTRLSEDRPFIRPFLDELKKACTEEYAKYNHVAE